jgi:hypothetical protein
MGQAGEVGGVGFHPIAAAGPMDQQVHVADGAFDGVWRHVGKVLGQMAADGLHNSQIVGSVVGRPAVRA